ncbi:MAG: carbon-nitrogen family hydrolase, partial [Anaerolineae bacterium]|nr:carbon-nitrogen family hydrolase [Anaerolineae bacterium]
NAAVYAADLDEGVFAETAVLAYQYNIHIVGSCLSQLGDGKIGNTAVFFNNNGTILADYSKIHLFRLMDEHQFLTAGNHLAIAETPWGKMGLAICYDLRFPELFRSYALADCILTFLPAEWPHPRLAHWQTLLRARAIENQMYLVACNRVGQSKGSDFCGHSCIIDPWGEVLVEGGEAEEFVTAEIDLERVTAVRSTIPVFKDRRPAIYEHPFNQTHKDSA